MELQTVLASPRIDRAFLLVRSSEGGWTGPYGISIGSVGDEGMTLRNTQTLHGTAIYAAPLTPLAPPQLIGIYGSPNQVVSGIG